jgi:hypothetical protein
MAFRLGRLEFRRAAWLVPSAAGVVVTAYLAWGAWVSAHDPSWTEHSSVWWQWWLRPDDDWTLLIVVGVWLVALLCYWWPRRLQAPLVAMATVVSMVLIGGVLGTVSLLPCRGSQTYTAVVGQMLGLYLGNAPSAYQTASCPGQPPLALQLGEVVCLGATLVGALAVAAVVWRKPVSRLLARAVRDATVFTGLDPMTLPLLQRLAQTRRPSRIIVIEPDQAHPLLGAARATGARIMIGDPASSRVLAPVLASWRGCALSFLYALWPDAAENEAVLAAAYPILGRYQPDPERQPHLIVRIDDPRHANYWRGWRCGTSSRWFEDALSAQEVTACALVNEIFRTGARQLLLCGDSTLALAILLELARRSWERRGLIEAASAGLAAHPDTTWPDGTKPDGSEPNELASFPLEHVVLLDRRAEDLRREFHATSPHSITGGRPVVTAQPDPWMEHLLATLDAMTPAAAAETAVVITDRVSEDGMHEAGRVARLHPGIPVFVLTSDGAGSGDAIFDQLRPFQRTLLIRGEEPEDTWTRVARYWHECFRLRNPPVPGEPRALTGRPWAELDEYIRRDNILQLRSVMTAVVAHGRRWVPRRVVAPGSFVELNDRELEEIVRGEHARCSGDRARARLAATNGHALVPWDRYRASGIESLRTQLAQLEDAGFMPILPQGGPPGAAKFERVGVVRAKKLQTRRRWTRRSGDELFGNPGDWRVLDDSEEERTVQDPEFRASHEPLGGDLWRRTGTYSAWRATEKLVVRTKEGPAIAHPGDWVVEGYRGERWPVTDEQFRRTYQEKRGERGEQEKQ